MSDAARAAAALERLGQATALTRWTTPRGVAAHRARVTELIHSGREAYPEPFEYPIVDADAVRALCDDVDKSAVDIESPSSLLRVGAHVNRVRRLVGSLAGDDDTEWAVTASELYGLPTRETRAAATRLLSAPEDHAEPHPRPPDLRGMVESALGAYGLGWQVKVSRSMAAKMSVSGPTNTVRIREGVEVSPLQARRLVVHEIGGHVLRWENSRRQEDPLLAVALGDTTPTEEGLAVLLEQEFGLHDVHQLRVYAARVLAVDLAQERGVIGVARHLAPLVGAASAAEIAVRVKRGLRDPNAPGGLTKDHGYLSGLLAVQGQRPETIELLRSVKWPIDALADLAARRARGELAAPVYVADARLLPSEGA